MSGNSPGSAGIYIHIPFCRQACIYCNFHFSTSLKLKEPLVASIIRELEMRKDYFGDQAVETIYFGGGTPSLLSAGEINLITDTIFKHYRVDRISECTLEANPDDLDRKYLDALRGTPVNRLSIGVQSFREEDLRYMKRVHSAQQADYSIKAAQDAGFTNLTIDLIYGVPGMQDARWIENLHNVKRLGIPHFSAYALTVEDKTALQHAIAVKKSAPVDHEQSAAQFEILMETASEMGYEHYEISNLALPGFEAIHNSNYWRGSHYLGIGPAAHSFNGVTRRWNVSNNPSYIKGILETGQPEYGEERLTPTEHLNEYIMTSLRTMWGCDLEKIKTGWSGDTAVGIINSAAPFLERKWMIQDGHKLILTRSGKMFADRIAAELFVHSVEPAA